MSYRAMSNREGNQQRIIEMSDAKMSPGVIAAYMTDWKVPMSSLDVQGIINAYKPMGNHAVKEADVQKAIETHNRFIEPLNARQSIIEKEEGDETAHSFDAEFDVQ